MDICIFYSWQSDYREDCTSFIEKALNRAVKELNKQQNYNYYIERGGGGLKGSEDINMHIDEVLKYEACIIVSDFTHIGQMPEQNADGTWIKKRGLPNPNVVDETARAKERIGAKQIIRVNNTYYGDYNTNIEMYFDIRNERYPIGYNYHKNIDDDEKRLNELNNLESILKRAIKDSTEEYLKHRNTRFSPLIPITTELNKPIYLQPFYPPRNYSTTMKYIDEGRSFRLLGFPGMGKTRTICEAFKKMTADVNYCDCNNLTVLNIKEPIIKLIRSNKSKQTIILDNCKADLCSDVRRMIDEYSYNCQLITIYYDMREVKDSDVDYITLDLEDNESVVQRIINGTENMDENDKSVIKDLSGGFPFMAHLLCEKYHKGDKIAAIKKTDIYNRILNINPSNTEDTEKKKVLTAFAIFKFIGLDGYEAEQGKFIASNPIITDLINRDNDAKFTFFRKVFNEYSQNDILEKSGHMGLMRLIPLAIFLAEQWYQHQDSDSINTLITQITNLPDEWTQKMLIDSLAKRITLLSDIPLAQELINKLLDINSPFLKEEVVLSQMGSRLFLGFSEVNPETCANALFSVIKSKSDEELKDLEESRRNLAWALDHLAFDRRSFKNAMLTIARFSLVETENWLSNNTTELFIERFPILLPGTEATLSDRLDVLQELSSDTQYSGLIKKALLMAINVNHNHRFGGAEKQGLKKLSDYSPKTYGEVLDYFDASFNIYMELAHNNIDIDEICNTIVSNARGYYRMGFDEFLFNALEALAPKKDYTWDEMRDTLDDLTKYDVERRNNYRLDYIREWLHKLTKYDYVSRLKDICHKVYGRNLSFNEEMEQIDDECKRFAHEFIDSQLYKDAKLISAIMQLKCNYMNRYGGYLAEYAQEKGIQKILLDNILSTLLEENVTKDGEALFVHYIYKVNSRELVEKVYETIANSDKKNILPTLYAIKDESEVRLSQLFDMLDTQQIELNDFNGYFLYVKEHQKYVLKRLLNYGDDATAMILMRYDSFLYNKEPDDDEYKTIARELLHKFELRGVMMDDYSYCKSVQKYLSRHRDEDLVLHIHKMVEEMQHSIQENHHLAKLYWTVFHEYKDLLKPLVLQNLSLNQGLSYWIKMLTTCFSNDIPSYMELSYNEWFEWLDSGDDLEGRACVLADVFRYAEEDNKANPYVIKLLDNYYSKKVIGTITARLESFGWIGSGIPLYNDKITICKDYIAKLQNNDAKQCFYTVIKSFEAHIAEEKLGNANKKAIYGE